MREKKTKLLSELCEVITKGTTPTTMGYEFQDEGINFLKIESFDIIGTFIPDKVGYISEECHQKFKRSQLKVNDILFSIAGAIGRVAIVTQEMLPANTNQALAIIRINNASMYIPYVKLVLTSKFITDQFNRQKQGVAQLNLSLKNIGDLLIPIIPYNEQVHLVELFEKVKLILMKRNTQLELLDDIIKSRFVELFGSPVSNPKQWKVLSLDESCSKLTDGTHFSPENLENGDYKYITAKNIKLSGFDLKDLTYISKEAHKGIYPRCNPEYGDVLYIKDGATTGIAMINTLHEEFSLLSSVALLKQNRDIINGYYLCSALNNSEMYSNVRSTMGGAAITRLTITKLKQIELPIPPIGLQNQYAEFVQQVDKLKVEIQKSLDETQGLFDALMQKYFE